MNLGRCGVGIGRFSDIEVRIEGHTDSQGSASSNQRLSDRRANSVRQYLIKMALPSPV